VSRNSKKFLAQEIPKADFDKIMEERFALYGSYSIV
jgi:hypothetical protein